MYLYVYIQTYIYIHTYIYIYILYICIHTNKHLYANTYTYICTGGGLIAIKLRKLARKAGQLFFTDIFTAVWNNDINLVKLFIESDTRIGIYTYIYIYIHTYIIYILIHISMYI
jgi:hypothetical protein